MVETTVPQSLLDRYPACWRPRQLERCPTGFSGGTVWRAETEGGPLALRQWPAGQTPRRLGVLHRLLRLALEEGCDFVPQPIASVEGATWIVIHGTLWELCTWMPGSPWSVPPPPDSALSAAVGAVGRLHRAFEAARADPDLEALGDPGLVGAFRSGRWVGSASRRSETGETPVPPPAPPVPPPAPCPAMARRRNEWRRLLGTVLRPLAGAPPDPLDLARRTQDLVRRHGASVEEWLGGADDPVSIRLCLRDVHREHILFTGDVVTGVVDFGSCGLDTPACDLARLLGSLVPEDAPAWQRAFGWYRQVAPLSDAEADLALRLDRTGAMIGAMHWLEWLMHERRRFSNPQAAYHQWRGLVERIERASWQSEVLALS